MKVKCEGCQEQFDVEFAKQFMASDPSVLINEEGSHITCPKCTCGVCTLLEEK